MFQPARTQHYCKSNQSMMGLGWGLGSACPREGKGIDTNCNASFTAERVYNCQQRFGKLEVQAADRLNQNVSELAIAVCFHGSI